MKKVLSLFMAVVMLFTLTAGIDFSASAEISGDYEYAVLDDGTAEITDYTGSATDLIIPSIIDGYNVTSICNYAFEFCDSLTSVTIPNSVTSISDYAFLACHSLTSVTIPDSVTSIGVDVFVWCISLTSITVDSNNTNYSSQDGVLFDKNKTTLIQYPIGNARTSYTVPNSVTSIGDGAFRDCDSLTSVTVDNNNTNYSSQDGVLFDKNKTTLIQYPIGNARTSYAIPNSVTSIGDNAFNHCVSLTSVTIPNSVTSIGNGAFLDCDSLTSVTIGNSVTSIGSGAFEGCDSLTDVYYTGTIDEWNLISIEDNNEFLTNANIHYNYVPVCNHIWNNGVVTVNPTCTANGAKTFTCTACGDSYTEPIPATGHNFGSNNPCCLVCGIGNPYYVAPTPTPIPASKLKVTLSTTTYTYSGKVRKPSVTVKDSKGKKISSSNYSVSYAKGRKYVGKYAVKVKFKGNYSGTKTVYFTIKPKSTSISSLKTGKKKFTVKWKKQTSQTSGYQIQYSTSSKFKSSKYVTVSGNKNTSKTVSKLKAKKKYYVRVRTYKTVKVNGKSTKIYSNWSKIKTVTTKR